MNKSVLKKLAVMIPLLSVAVTGLMGVSSPVRTEDKPEVCEFDCGIGEKSNFSLNAAQVVGGGEKVDGRTGTTYIYSPDGKFRLVQGERMYVEYVDKDSITDYSGKAQNIPGSITLRWPKAAYEAKTGELLDVELTLSDIKLRVADYENNYVDEHDLRSEVRGWPLVFMHNNNCSGRDRPDCNSFDNDLDKELDPYHSTLFATSTLAAGFGDPACELVDSTFRLTYRLIRQDGTESDQVGTSYIGDFTKPGMIGGIGNWSPNWDQVDPMQPHVKVLSKGACLRRNTSDRPWETPGVQLGEERPCKQAWSKERDPNSDSAEFVEMTVKSGLTIELSNQENTLIDLGRASCNSHYNPGELRVRKVGKGDSVFTGKDANGHNVTKALNGSTVEFTYEVHNPAPTPVWDIEVTDSKGVKVTCPKTVLVGGESMTCTGTGVVRAEPGK